MLSRVAESLFWMSRYIERAENTARFLDVNFHLLLDLDNIVQVDSASYWKPLIQVTSDEERFRKLHNSYTGDNVTDFLVFNRQNPNSIYSCLELARENARSIIETISSEMWEQVNNMYHYFTTVTREQLQRDPYNFYKEIKNGSHLFQGITDSTLSRSDGWDYVQVGKFLERADNTARLLDVKYHLLKAQARARDNERFDPVDTIQWMAVLKSCSALESFRKKYLSKIEPDTILHFLILERGFPRSVYFSIIGAQEALWRISGSSRRQPTTNADRLIGKLEAELSYTSIEDILEKGSHDYLEDLEKRLIRIGDAVHQIYFAYREPDLTSSEGLVFAGGRAVWSQAQAEQQQQ